MRYRAARRVPGRNRPSLAEEEEDETRSFDDGELDVATVSVAEESRETGVPQARQKRLFSGRSLEHLRHFVVCIRLMYHSGRWLTRGNSWSRSGKTPD